MSKIIGAKMSYEYRVVDAFASQPFQGNPAAVVLAGDALSDSDMRQIAAEFNLSETVFVLSPTRQREETTVRLRWFTPQCEVSFCGHASLAAVHALCERLVEKASPPSALLSNTTEQADSTASSVARHSVALPSEIGLDCAAGNLSIKIESAPDGTRYYWLAMPRPELRTVAFPTELLADALQLAPDVKFLGPPYQTRDRDLILFLDDGERLRSLSPDMAKLDRLSRAHGVRGVSVASIDSGDPRIACISRFFAPAAGIPEDPATGSVHGPLAALLIQGSHVAPVRPGRWSFLCRQVPRNGRMGDVHVRANRRAEDLAVEVGGACVTVMAGRISLGAS